MLVVVVDEAGAVTRAFPRESPESAPIPFDGRLGSFQVTPGNAVLLAVFSTRAIPEADVVAAIQRSRSERGPGEASAIVARVLLIPGEVDRATAVLRVEDR